VANALGAGFLEKVHENALAFELRSHSIETKIKSTKASDLVHFAQCGNYLKATGLNYRQISATLEQK
jgi:hypothetical protein